MANEKLILALVSLGVPFVYVEKNGEVEKVRFNPKDPKLPEGVEFAAIDRNTFISEKNRERWLKYVESREVAPTEESVSLESVVSAAEDAPAEGEKQVNLDEMTKDELEAFANENFGVDIDKRLSKENMIQKIMNLASGE